MLRAMRSICLCLGVEIMKRPMNLKALSSLVLLVSMGVSGNGFAAQQVKSGEFKSSVVELYTSEGCSSCPPADSFLSRLGKTEESAQIVPMAFHVDYWDYIGWEDPYADAKFTGRQRKVAKRNNQASIYTPEFVVDGVEARGSRQIADRLLETQRSPAEADLTLNISDIVDGKLTATVSLDRLGYQGDEQPVLYLALLESSLHSRINAGENRGKTLEHDYVVRYLSAPQSTTQGQQHPFELELDPQWARESLAVSVVVRLRDSGATLQALKASL